MLSFDVALPIDHNPDPDSTSEYKNKTSWNKTNFLFENTKYILKIETNSLVVLMLEN
jgi:hypothetical protein